MAPKSDTLNTNSTLKPPRSPNGVHAALAGRRPSSGHGQVRKHGVEWNNREDIDDGRDEALEVSDDECEGVHVGDSEMVEKRSPAGGQVMDLLDAARVLPAKPKGIAKDFEVVQGSPRVITLPDEPDGPSPTEEDWENIDSEDAESRQSYSAVVRSNDHAPR